MLRLLAVLGPPAMAPSAAAAAAAASAAATSSSVCAADVTVLAPGLVLWVLLALLPLTRAPGLVVPRHLRLPCLCRSSLPPILDPSPLRVYRPVTSCRLQPVLPWAQWPMAFSRPSSPFFLPCCVCLPHDSCAPPLLVNTGLVSAQSRRTDALANCLFFRVSLSPGSLSRPGNYSGLGG